MADIQPAPTNTPIVRDMLIEPIWGNWLNDELVRLFNTNSSDLDDHNHDDRYYTETEIDNNLYTRSQVQTLVEGVDTSLNARAFFLSLI